MQHNILIVEDDHDLRENICSILQNEGFDVTEAGDGIQAMEKLDVSISLVILDIMMPGISGIETCQQIRRFSYVPILFLTAKSSESDKVHGFYAGGDYLSELCLFLSEENFQVHADKLFAKEVKVRIHTDYMSRIIHNLFSNIKKYADKKDRILIVTSYTDTELIISCKNRIDRNAYHSGTGIGTKNIALMMQKMGGKAEEIADADFYEMRLYFPIQKLK